MTRRRPESYTLNLRRFKTIVSARWKQTWIEWGFVALLAALCVVLFALQYRWTGEISRAEAEQLRAGINGEARQFGEAFDSALTGSCEALVPANGSVNDENRAAIHQQCFEKWKALHARPLFSQVAIVVPTFEGVELCEQNLTNGTLSPLAWPAAWNSLRQRISRGPGGGHPGFENPPGTMILFPIFAERPDRDGPSQDGGPPEDGGPPRDRGPFMESEWMIFELDTNYLRTTWLPELVRTYLNPPGLPASDVQVKTISSPHEVIFTSSAGFAHNGEPPVVLAFNRQGRDLENVRGPGPDLRWVLEVRPQPGALDAVVSAAHWKNLGVAILLNSLVFAAGLALVRHTRRSRTLAETQMNFVANVSHELRTPLTVIRGAAHNLKRGVVQDRGQIEQYAGLIMHHAGQLGEMVEQVLALAGAQRTNPPALRPPVALNEVLRDAITATAHDTQAAQCEVQLELPPALPVISGDAAALRRVFQNLISNAAKHSGEKWIGVTAVSDEEARPPIVEVQVADRGAGIPADEQANIFKPFFRGARAQALHVRGSGLGLSLVREIVEAHGGTVAVRSGEGTGTTFTVRLPVAAKTK